MDVNDKKEKKHAISKFKTTKVTLERKRNIYSAVCSVFCGHKKKKLAKEIRGGRVT